MSNDYENKGFPFGHFILKLILIIIFVFLLCWLLPKFMVPAITKSKNGNCATCECTGVKALTSQIFANNLDKMKEAAISYYTSERLPQNVGDSKKLTLSDMIGLKIITPLIDKNNKAVVGPEALVGGAVPALVLALVDVAVFIHPAEDALNGLDVIFVGGTDEAVVGDVHQLPEILDALFALDDAIDERLGRDAGFPGLGLDFLPVLIGAGEEDHIRTPHSLIPGHHVGRYGAVGVTDMKAGRRIINGGCDKVFVFALFTHDENPPCVLYRFLL